MGIDPTRKKSFEFSEDGKSLIYRTATLDAAMVAAAEAIREFTAHVRTLGHPCEDGTVAFAPVLKSVEMLWSDYSTICAATTGIFGTPVTTWEPESEESNARGGQRGKIRLGRGVDSFPQKAFDLLVLAISFCGKEQIDSGSIPIAVLGRLDSVAESLEREGRALAGRCELKPFIPGGDSTSPGPVPKPDRTAVESQPRSQPSTENSPRRISVVLRPEVVAIRHPNGKEESVVRGVGIDQLLVLVREPTRRFNANEIVAAVRRVGLGAILRNTEEPDSTGSVNRGRNERVATSSFDRAVREKAQEIAASLADPATPELEKEELRRQSSAIATSRGLIIDGRGRVKFLDEAAKGEHDCVRNNISGALRRLQHAAPMLHAVVRDRFTLRAGDLRFDPRPEDPPIDVTW